MLPQSLIIEVINSLHLPSQSILSSLKIFVSFDPTSSVDDCVPRHPVCCTQEYVRMIFAMGRSRGSPFYFTWFLVSSRCLLSFTEQVSPLTTKNSPPPDDGSQMTERNGLLTLT